MIVKKEIGKDDLAKVYIAETKSGMIEFAESVQPPLTRDDKWVIIISCLVGCPVQCLMCDAGRSYSGPLSKEEMFEQIDYLVNKRFPDGNIATKQFKIQFTRMGEPAYNPEVLEVLKELPARYSATGLMPSVSTIGPSICGDFFQRLTEIKSSLYLNGKFQMQFSMHTTDAEKRDVLIPAPKMSFEEIASFGKKFFKTGDRKVTLNFVVMEEYSIDPEVINKYFDPSIFIIKLTPLNPTGSAKMNALTSGINPHDERAAHSLIERLHELDYDTILSIGELEENEIGSNCGQYVTSASFSKNDQCLEVQQGKEARLSLPLDAGKH
jgi:23S rRNA (adenine2503-C2)-methyltransferase